ncbi:hypothetical protein BH10PLA1_BH10PLA1_21180 [soil metagenome]
MTDSAASQTKLDSTAADHLPLEILVEDLHKSFGHNYVLQGINLSVGRGEIVAIVGGSGCGKTVLLQNMIGQMNPDRGRIQLADHESPGAPLVDRATLDEEGMDRLRIHWAVVFQRNALTSGTVEENIVLPLLLVKGLDEADAHQRASQAIESVGLQQAQTLRLQRE